MTLTSLVLIIRSVQPVISADQMREIDRQTVQNHHIPSNQLMRAAAEACFKAIELRFVRRLVGLKARILCGKGNNGGDGAALAQQLAQAGVHTQVVLFGKVEETRGDARENFEIVSRPAVAEGGSGASKLTFVECTGEAQWNRLSGVDDNHDIIVDALFGTGLTRPLEGLFAQVIQHLKNVTTKRELQSASRPLVVSIDVPSGLNADSSQPFGEAVNADLTVTFTAPKPANVLPPASDLNGELVVADIGSPRTLVAATKTNLFVTEEEDAREWLKQTRFQSGSYKNSHGSVLVIAGSRGYTGAAVLCGNAAMRSGAGLVTIATPASAQPAVAATAMPEIMTVALAETDRGAVSEQANDHVMKLAARATVIAIGPGLTAEDERTRRFVHSVVKHSQKPVIIDADALNCLAPWPESLSSSAEAPLILTPHPGEMLRLLGEIEKSLLEERVNVARDFATRHRVILVLKGSKAVIAAPNGNVFINPTGNPGLGTAGSGDTLTGLIAGFLAQAFAENVNADALKTTLTALFVGGLAGDLAARKIGMRTMVASDIREYLGAAIRSLDPIGEQP